MDQADHSLDDLQNQFQRSEINQDISDYPFQSSILEEFRPLTSQSQMKRNCISNFQNQNSNQIQALKSPSPIQKESNLPNNQINFSINSLFVDEQNQKMLYEIIGQAKFLEDKYINEKLNDAQAIQNFLTKEKIEQKQNQTPERDECQSISDWQYYPKQSNQGPFQTFNQSKLFNSKNKQKQPKQYVPKQSQESQIGVDSKNARSYISERKSEILDDPELKEKQQIMEQIHEILKNFSIISKTRRHSILEVAMILCLIYLPNIREGAPFSEKNYNGLRSKYKMNRPFEGFKRKYSSIMYEIKYWGRLKHLQQILVTLRDDKIDFTNFYIELDNKTKEILFPMDRRPDLKQHFDYSQIEQNKQLVLPVLTKKLKQYVSFSAQEIEEDKQEFEDDAAFIKMILQLIPLAL